MPTPRFWALILLGWGLGLALTARAGGAEPDWRPLFDGRTLDGWEGNLDIFRVRDGAIVGGQLDKPVARNEFLCTTQEYGDFELRVAFKLLGQGANAGIQFRTRRIPNHHEVIGYQADLGGKYWGCLYDESRRRKILAQPDAATLEGLVKHDDWNEYRIRAEGPRIQLWLNGRQTVDFEEPDPAVERRGLIAVQIHGGPPSEAWYRDLRIRELAP